MGRVWGEQVEKQRSIPGVSGVGVERGGLRLGRGNNKKGRRRAKKKKKQQPS